jgi:hypothetical protein
VQVPYGEGVATHIGPEPCADVVARCPLHDRRATGEARADVIALSYAVTKRNQSDPASFCDTPGSSVYFHSSQ